MIFVEGVVDRHPPAPSFDPAESPPRLLIVVRQPDLEGLGRQDSARASLEEEPDAYRIDDEKRDPAHADPPRFNPGPFGPCPGWIGLPPMSWSEEKQDPGQREPRPTRDLHGQGVERHQLGEPEEDQGT